RRRPGRHHGRGAAGRHRRLVLDLHLRPAPAPRFRSVSRLRAGAAARGAAPRARAGAGALGAGEKAPRPRWCSLRHPSRLRGRDALVARLRAAPGPVFVPFHPFYARRAGKPPTLHAQNLADINAIAGLGTPRDLVEAIRARALALVVLDVEGEGEAFEQAAM